MSSWPLSVELAQTTASLPVRDLHLHLLVVALPATRLAHTNLFIQETRGGSVEVDAQFFGESGNMLGTSSYSVGPFRLTGDFFSATNPVLPDGAVTAVLTARAGSTGAFSAYATPVDKASGDFWSIVD